MVRGARPHRLHVRAEGRPEAPQATGASRTTQTSSRASVPSSTAQGCASASRSRPGLVDGRTISGRPRGARREARAARRRSASRTSACSSTTSRPTLRDPLADRGEAHADLAAWLHDRLGGDVLLSLVPTEYIGTLSSPYLDALARVLPPDDPDRLDRRVGRERRDHRRRRARSRRGPRRAGSAAVGQRAGERRGDGRPALHGAAARARSRAPRALLRLPREPDGATTRLDASARLDRGMVRGRRRGRRLA